MSRSLFQRRLIDPSPLKDVHIYMATLPLHAISDHMSNTEWLRQCAMQYGRVQVVDLVASRVADGSMIGFIHMSSEAQADELIKHLKCICIDGKWIKAHKEKVSEARATKKERRSAQPRPCSCVDGRRGRLYSWHRQAATPAAADHRRGQPTARHLTEAQCIYRPRCLHHDATP